MWGPIRWRRACRSACSQNLHGRSLGTSERVLSDSRPAARGLEGWQPEPGCKAGPQSTTCLHSEAKTRLAASIGDDAACRFAPLGLWSGVRRAVSDTFASRLATARSQEALISCMLELPLQPRLLSTISYPWPRILAGPIQSWWRPRCLQIFDQKSTISRPRRKTEWSHQAFRSVLEQFWTTSLVEYPSTSVGLVRLRGRVRLTFHIPGGQQHFHQMCFSGRRKGGSFCRVL